jgi:hypothetical protein
MKIGIMQPYFFPYIGYFQLIHCVDTYVNLDHVSFMKRSYMTRNVLKNNTPINVNVWGASQNKKCNEIYVNFENNYISNFLKKLENLYSKESNYDIILNDIILPEFINREVTISELNLNLIKRICDYLDIQTKIINTSNGFTTLKKEKGLKSIIKQIGSNVYINAIGGQSLYNKEDFKNDNIELNFIKMGNVDFDNKNSSILDLLFRYDKSHIQKQIVNYKLI